MSQNHNESSPPSTDTSPEALVEESRSLPLVWLIPLVAGLIGLWLAYKTLSEQGPLISITFKEAVGLEAGKTKIKYKDVEVGLLQTVELSGDLSKVVATARMSKTVASHLGADSRFWVVKPQLGLGGVSGLDTLIAGNYVAVEFGSGQPGKDFIGLEHAPKISADTPGRSFILVSYDAGALKEGAPIYFRNIQVGRVVETRLADNKQSVRTEIFIDAPFDQLIHDKTRFWLTDAIDMSMDAQGFNLKVGSLLSMLVGGIAFDTPDVADPNGHESVAGTEFTLHPNFTDVGEGAHSHKQTFLLYFDDSVRGLQRGAPVEVRGMRVGTVTDVHLDLDFQTKKFRIPVTIDLDPEDFASGEAVRKYMAAYQDQIAQGRRPVIESLVAQGMRARLKTGSFLTGQLYVDLDLYPDVPPKTLVYGGPYPEIPTLPSLSDELQKSAMDIMASLKKIPFEKIGNELLGTVQGANRLTNAPELQQTIRDLDAAMKQVQSLARTADTHVAALATGMEQSLGSVKKALGQLEPGAPMTVNLNKALEELSSAARSLRNLSDYLDRHPEALLKGKSGATP
ncbi:paraquat-inducible protein B [Methylomagnum ishizawai]|uniref:Paraquat-inducible protein B n=1 Tax=Methylomagnum ishizawai TaxID=1760988 RepID=A0A1Y6D0N5_9GAMM|nr:MlaD family protein [Methylomagnum ishizawai]SMF93555.1 paraquat-inducible protein B [Methylomagnum ishizawai]